MLATQKKAKEGINAAERCDSFEIFISQIIHIYLPLIPSCIMMTSLEFFLARVNLVTLDF